MRCGQGGKALAAQQKKTIVQSLMKRTQTHAHKHLHGSMVRCGVVVLRIRWPVVGGEAVYTT